MNKSRMIQWPTAGWAERWAVGGLGFGRGRLTRAEQGQQVGVARERWLGVGVAVWAWADRWLGVILGVFF